MINKNKFNPIGLDDRLMFVMNVIRSGLPRRALRRLRELEPGVLNKGTLNIYLNALEALDASTPAVTLLVDSCIEEGKKQRSAPNN